MEVRGAGSGGGAEGTEIMAEKIEERLVWDRLIGSSKFEKHTGGRFRERWQLSLYGFSFEFLNFEFGVCLSVR